MMKNRNCTIFALTLLAWTLTTGKSLAQTIYEPYTFSTLAGGVGPGSADGTGSAARFNQPSGIAADSAGNVYVADTGNNTIRKVTPAGVVTTLAGQAGSIGSADGVGSDARFNQPSGVAVDSTGNVYVADTYNNEIRKVTPAGVVTTLAGLAQFDLNGNPVGGGADGTGKAAQFNFPQGVAVDIAGNIYVADRENSTIRKVTPAGVVTTLAGMAGSCGSADRTGIDAQFCAPRDVAVDSTGNVYVADERNFTIREVTPEGVVTTLAGLAGSYGGADGTGSAARFGGFLDVSSIGPYGVAVDSAGNVYVADTVNFRIRKVTSEGVVTTLAGGGHGSADGTGSAAQFGGEFGGTFHGGPTGVAVDADRNVYVADTGNNTIRKGYPALAISDLLYSANGQFGFMLTGPPGQLVVVESSTDLVSWLPVSTNTFAGALNFSDPQSGFPSKRFYRAHTP
jgi:sugar lactone lactonase YvrE